MRFSAFSIWAFVAALLLLSACEMPIDNGETSSSPQTAPGIPVAQLFKAEPGLTPRQRFRKAISLLETGEAAHARVELDAYLLEVPKSKLAAGLLSQIDADPVAVLGSDSVNYTLKQGESLSIVAGRFLGDKMKFYLLARYNDMENPSSVAAGTVIRVPRRSQIAARPPQQSGKPGRGTIGSNRPTASKPKTSKPTVSKPPASNPLAPKPQTSKPVKPDMPNGKSSTAAASPALPTAPQVLPPETPMVTEAEMIKEVIGQGRELSAAGDKNGVVNHLEEGLIQFPDEKRIVRALTVAYLSRADQFAGQRQYRQAISDLERARELDPKNRKVKKNLALVVGKKRADDQKRAEEKRRADELKRLAALKRAEEQQRTESRQRADDLVLVGVNYRKANAPLDALAAVKAALKVWPEHERGQREMETLKPLVGKYYYQQGMTAMQRQKLAEAIALFDKGLEVDPDNDTMKRARRLALTRCDKFKKLTNSTSCAAKK